MSLLEKTCPPNIGPNNRLYRLAIGAGAIIIAVLVPDPILKALLLLAAAFSIAEALISHCFVLAAFGRKDFS